MSIIDNIIKQARKDSSKTDAEWGDEIRQALHEVIGLNEEDRLEVIPERRFTQAPANSPKGKQLIGRIYRSDVEQRNILRQELHKKVDKL